MVEVLEDIFTHIEYLVDNINSDIEYNKEYLQNNEISEYSREGYKNNMEFCEYKLKALQAVEKNLENLI